MEPNMEVNLFSKYGQTLDEGKVIFREGEEGDKMYIIQEGSVRITKAMGTKEHTLAVLSKGDFFGEMAIVSKTPRSATATAATTVKLLGFDREGFVSMIEKNAKIALNIIDKLSRRLQQANLQIQHLVRHNERGFIALNLLYSFSVLASEGGVMEQVRLLRELSLSMEIPQESIKSFVDELREEGILELQEGGILKLVDRRRLSALAENRPGQR
jgi:CRP/FNR family transcriptional regulator, cyclic AMP receptor protein